MNLNIIIVIHARVGLGCGPKSRYEATTCCCSQHDIFSECKPVLEQLDQEKVGPVGGYVSIPAGSKKFC